MESFFFAQKCKSNNNCDVFQHFTIPLNSYDETGNCILDKTERKPFSFK